MTMSEDAEIETMGAWMQNWLDIHRPLLSKKGRWRVAHDAWLEHRRQVRKAEREAARGSVSPLSLARARRKKNAAVSLREKREGVDSMPHTQGTMVTMMVAW
jgi:hypothetical protein